MIGIGADHRQLARGELAQQTGIVSGLLGLVVEQAGADHELGVLMRPELDIEPVEDRPVALRPEMEHGRAVVLGELVAGEIAGGDGRVIGVVGHAEAAELLLDRRARPRRVGQQHHDAALGAKRARGGDRAGEGAMAVMHHAPDVDQPGAITRAELLDRVEHGNFRGGDSHGVR